MPIRIVLLKPHFSNGASPYGHPALPTNCDILCPGEERFVNMEHTMNTICELRVVGKWMMEIGGDDPIVDPDALKLHGVPYYWHTGYNVDGQKGPWCVCTWKIGPLKKNDPVMHRYTMLPREDSTLRAYVNFMDELRRKKAGLWIEYHLVHCKGWRRVIYAVRLLFTVRGTRERYRQEQEALERQRQEEQQRIHETLIFADPESPGIERILATIADHNLAVAPMQRTLRDDDDGFSVEGGMQLLDPLGISYYYYFPPPGAPVLTPQFDAEMQHYENWSADMGFCD